jgi:hypothetical protein
MKRCLGLLCVAAGLATVSARADLLTLLYPPEPDIIVNTDVVDPTAVRASPANPVYYIEISRGYRDFGFEMAGEKIPDDGVAHQMVTKILESQGYKVATKEHPATLMILYAWGTFYLNPNPHAAHTYGTEMLEFLGAAKLGANTDARSTRFPELNPELRTMRPDTSTVSGFLPHGMYVITFWAFDYARALRGDAWLLWKTNVSASTRGFYLPEVLPTMLTVAAPMIGRETNRPIRIDVGKHYHPNVELGPLKVLDDDVKPKKDKGL